MFNDMPRHLDMYPQAPRFTKLKQHGHDRIIEANRTKQSHFCLVNCMPRFIRRQDDARREVQPVRRALNL